MLKASVFAASLIMAGWSQASASTINWVNWTSETPDTSVAGTMTIGGQAVGVTFSGNYAFSQLAGGINYWGADPATSPYTSIGPGGVDNIPTGSDIIALDQPATYTITFSQAIQDMVFAFVSLNGNALAFTYDFTVLSSAGENLDGNGTDACGYWGCGTTVRTASGNEYFLGGEGEPHGAAKFTGVFTSITFRSVNNEYWHGFTVGAANLAPSPVPLPGALVLLLSALGATGVASRFRKKTV
jgi:hypothetical protein